MNNKDRVIELINDKRETPLVDFKRDFYKKLVGSDFPKDICAFANLASDEDRYIIFGVEDKSREIYGVDPKTIPSTDTLDNYLNKTVDPFVAIESDLFEYCGKTVAYVKISAANDNPPYMIKKTCGPRFKLEKGDIYIRKGTCNQKAERMDIDVMYTRNGSCTPEIFDGYMKVESDESAAKPQYLLKFRIEIDNRKRRSLLIRNGSVRLKIGTKTLTKKITSIEDTFLEVEDSSRKIYSASAILTVADRDRMNFAAAAENNTPVLAELALYDTDHCKYVSELQRVELHVK